MGDDPWSLLATIAAIAFVAGFIHSAIGFGFGIVAISLLPMVIDAKSAHVVVSVASVPMLMMAAWAYREGMEWVALRDALLGALIFLPIGLIFFVAVSLDLLVRGTGLAILGMVLLSLRNAQSHVKRDQPGRSCFVAGAVGGFFAGAVSIAGPPVAAFALRQDWDQARFKAFVTQCLLAMSIYKTVMLVGGGYFDQSMLGQTTVLAVVSILGVQLGVIASRGIRTGRFKKLVAIALILVAVMMMLRGQG